MKNLAFYLLLICLLTGACRSGSEYPETIKVTALPQDLKDQLYDQEKDNKIPKYVIVLEEQLVKRDLEGATATLTAMKSAPLNDFQKHYVSLREVDVANLAEVLKEEANEVAQAVPVAPDSDWWMGLSKQWQQKLLGDEFGKRMSAKDLTRLLNETKSFEVNPKEGYSDLSPLSALRKLKRISVNSNDIESIEPLRTLAEVRVIHAASNAISDIDALENMKELQSLYVANNKIDNIEVARNFGKLREVNISSNKVKDLAPLSKAVYLERIIANNNPITDLSPISKLNLQEVYISHTNIVDLTPLEKMKNLRILNISNTKITKLPALENCKNIKQLICQNHQLEKGQLEAFKKLHPDCKVVVD